MGIDTGKLISLFTDIYFLLTLIVCAILIVFKYEDFLLPYFSDEMWVYGPSIRKMGSSSPSMLPSSLALKDHWGHPMFFLFLGGLWCLVFGTSILSTHIFSVVFSVSLLVLIYLFGKKFFNKKVGFYTVAIFASQNIFLGQFSLVLPEILLTLLIFLTIYCFIQWKVFAYLVFSSCLVLTKETGVFPIIAIILWSLIRDFFYENEKIQVNLFIKKYVLLIFPLLVLGVHFLLLKITYGWFIMPVRMEAFEFDWEIYHERLMHAIHYVFIGQGRKPIIIILVITAVLFNNKYSIWVRLITILISFSMMKVFFKYWVLPDFFAMIIIPILLITLMKYIFWDIYKTNKKHGSIIAIFSIFILIYVLFSSAQFDSLRYLLCVIPIYIMIGLYFVQHIPYLRKVIYPGFAILAIGSSFFYISRDTNYGDDTNNYSNMVSAKLDAIRYLQENNYQSYKIEASFLFRNALTQPLSGYIETNEVFNYTSAIDLDFKNDDSMIYVIESTDEKEFIKAFKQNVKFDLIKQFKNDSAWIEIYVKN